MISKEEQAALARAAARGDREAFGKLYDAFIRPIYNFIYYKTHHQETAEDLVSIVFTKAFTNISSFNADKAPFTAWLYQIARNTVIDHYRTEKATSDIEDAWDIDDGTDIVRDFDAKQKLEKVQKYLAGLTPEQRDIVIMRVWQEMSYEEIAEVLGKSVDSCKMMFSRTMKKLRNEMPLETLLVFLTLGAVTSGLHSRIL